MKKILYTLTLALAGTLAQAQVKVGANPGTINGGSALEIEATDKGLLMPRVVLTSTTTWGLAGTPTAGMSVYNTGTGLTSSNTAYPAAGVGEYYWDGTGWVSKKSGAQLGADNGLTVGYNSTGNVGLGGTLSKNTDIATNGKTMSFSGTGSFGLGTTSPQRRLHLVNDNLGDLSDDLLIQTYSTNTTPGLFFSSTGGTIASPANIVTGRLLATVGSSGLVGGNEAAMSSIRFYYKGDGSTNLSNIDFLTSGNVSRMLLTENGNLGIGTSTPTRRLDINGDLRIQSTTTAPVGTNLVGLSIDPTNGNVYRASPLAAASPQTLVLVKSSSEDAITANNVFKKYVNITDEIYDPGSLWGNSQFTTPYTGKYIFSITGNFAVTSNNSSNSIIIQTNIFVNNIRGESYQGIVAFPGSGATNINGRFTVSGSSVLNLTAGDVVDLRHLTYNNGGLNIDETRILSLRVEAIPN